MNCPQCFRNRWEDDVCWYCDYNRAGPNCPECGGSRWDGEQCSHCCYVAGTPVSEASKEARKSGEAAILAARTTLKAKGRYMPTKGG